jgi:hypothetical protein
VIPILLNRKLVSSNNHSLYFNGGISTRFVVSQYDDCGEIIEEGNLLYYKNWYWLYCVSLNTGLVYSFNLKNKTHLDFTIHFCNNVSPFINDGELDLWGLSRNLLTARNQSIGFGVNYFSNFKKNIILNPFSLFFPYYLFLITYSLFLNPYSLFLIPKFLIFHYLCAS